MKTVLQTLPAWLKVLLYFLALWLATGIAGLVPPLNDFSFFLAISLLMSWLFLRAEGQALPALGFIPANRKDWTNFVGGVIVGCLQLILVATVTLLLTKDKWTINSHIDPVYLVIAFIMCLWSAFVQEFVFRGYPFQQLLKHYGAWIAQAVIAIPFGLMHVTSNMSFQDSLTVMLTTGLGSVLFGLAYLKTRKLMLPVGFHLGWNYAQQVIPRTAGGGEKGIILVSGLGVNYTVYTVLVPYVLMMILAIILLAVKKKETGITPIR